MEKNDTLTNQELETIVLKINKMLIIQGETINKLEATIKDLKIEVENSKLEIEKSMKSSSDIMEFLETVVCPQLSNTKM